MSIVPDTHTFPDTHGLTSLSEYFASEQDTLLLRRVSTGRVSIPAALRKYFGARIPLEQS